MNGPYDPIRPGPLNRQTAATLEARVARLESLLGAAVDNSSAVLCREAAGWWIEPDAPDNFWVKVTSAISPLTTTIALAITAGTAVTVTPASVLGIFVDVPVTVTNGATTEVVTPTAVTATTFTADFHSSYGVGTVVTGMVSAGSYSWVQVLRDTPVSWATDASGLAGDNGVISGVPSYPLREVNEIALPLGSVVRAWWSAADAEFLCAFEDGSGGGGGTLNVNAIEFSNGDTTYTPSADVAFIVVRIIGGGGGGGGAGVGSGAATGGGGGGGGYAEQLVTLSGGLTPFAISVGAGGAGGTAGVNGSDGGDTVWDSGGGGQITAAGGKGGTGGAIGSAVQINPGGAGGTASGNLFFHGEGFPGSPGIRLSGSVAMGGAGGKCAGLPLGSGGPTYSQADGAAGDNAVGDQPSGGGGAGGMSTGAGKGGGAGGGGVLIVVEFIFA